jgi:hypothetical protein
MAPSHASGMIVTGFAFLLTVSLSCVQGEEPTADELIKLAPVISSMDQRMRTIEIRGHYTEMSIARVNFRVLYKAPDRYALFVDAEDGAPFSLTSDNKMLVFDPIGESVLFFPGAAIDFCFRVKDGNIMFHLDTGPEAAPQKNRILFDIRSFFESRARSVQVARRSDRVHQLALTTEQGNTLTNYVDQTKKCPFTYMEFVGAEEARPSFCFDKIATNEDLAEKDFGFPSTELLSRKVRLVECSSNGLVSGASAWVVMNRARLALFGARYPELRDEIQARVIRKIDWDKVRDIHRLYSRTLGEVLEVSGREMRMRTGSP